MNLGSLVIGRQVLHAKVFSLKSRSKKSYQHKPPMQDRRAQVTLGGCNLPVKGRRHCRDKAGDRKQQMRKAWQIHRERRQQVPSASCKEPHLKYQQFPHSSNIAALRPCLRQILPKNWGFMAELTCLIIYSFITTSKNNFSALNLILFG